MLVMAISLGRVSENWRAAEHRLQRTGLAPNVTHRNLIQWFVNIVGFRINSPAAEPNR